MYGYETWSVLSQVNINGGLSENKFLWIIFTPKKDKVATGRLKMHSKEIHNFGCSKILLGQSNKGVWYGGACSTMGR
jgi:hypothetical protein